MSDGALLLIALGGLVLVAGSAGAETGAYAVNRARLRLAVSGGDRRARLLSRLVSALPELLAVVLVGRAFGHALVSFGVTLVLVHSIPRGAEVVSAIVVAPLLFVLGELAPKELFRRHADRFMLWIAPVLGAAGFVFAPVTRLLALLPRVLAAFGLREAKEDERALAAEELRLTIQASAEEGVLTDFQASLARNILSLKHRRVVSAMVPLARALGLEAGLSLEEARKVAARAGRSQLYVYRGVPEEAVGAVSFYDLFLDGSATTIESLVQPVPRLKPSDRVEDALLRLRMARATLAIVSGPDGKAVGIATLKDLCEEITGELDEL